ncbi:MAG TPA: YciI family protein [Solirubrobacteraceae bacterium]|jgi:hypothetical protein
MQYLLQIYMNGTTNERWEQLSEQERSALTDEYMAIMREPDVLGGAQLQPTTTATTVRVDDGKTLCTDGPFAETKETLGGYYLVEADDIERAIEVASRIPAARMGGSIEVRPLVGS